MTNTFSGVELNNKSFGFHELNGIGHLHLTERQEWRKVDVLYNDDWIFKNKMLFYSNFLI